MRAMVLDRARTRLVMRERQVPVPAAGEILVEVSACGVCRTDLHVVDGELPDPKVPIVPGHEIVGRVAACGEGVSGLAVGARIGVPWLAGQRGARRSARGAPARRGGAHSVIAQGADAGAGPQPLA